MKNHKNGKSEKNFKYMKYIIGKSRRNELLKFFASSFKLYIVLLLFISMQGKRFNIDNKSNIRNLLSTNSQINEDNKCLIFNEETNKCTECPPSFILINGVCEPNYSFKAIFKVDSQNEKVKLINDNYITYIKDMSINGTKIELNSYYTFENIGNYVLYVLIDVSKLDSILSMFSKVIKMISISFTNKFESKNIKNMNYMFDSCTSLTSIDFTHFDTTNVETTNYMFQSCRQLNSLDLSNFKTENLKETQYMFSQCNLLTYINFSSFNTGKLENANRMFYGCKAMTSLDISNFHTKSLKNMDYMFADCSLLTSLDLSHFDISNLNSLSGTFGGCLSITLKYSITSLINLIFTNYFLQ